MSTPRRGTGNAKWSRHPIAPEVSLDSLGMTYFAQFVGQAASSKVLAAIARKHGQVRASHGWVIQHLLGGPRSATELAKALAISQQAVSKSVLELERLGYVKEVKSDDARRRVFALSARGQDLVASTRKARGVVEDELRAILGAAAYEQTRTALRRALEHLGGADDVRARRVRPLP